MCALVNRESFVPVARISDVPAGGAVTVTVDGREIALFHLGDRFYAVDNTCPHQGGPLAEGWIDGETVTCPWHAWCFKLTDGKMAMNDFAGVDAFDVAVEGDEVFVSRSPRG
jgi:nitrite reductase (NADH) small subunit/3-phenylpropionate/trans-cinnamate dioxygenase ferredoxin subunit